MRKGCSTFKRPDAFLDSIPFSVKSAQARPFMVEGFLATLQRIDERCGSAVTLRALRYTGIAGICIAEPIIFP